MIHSCAAIAACQRVLRVVAVCTSRTFHTRLVACPTFDETGSTLHTLTVEQGVLWVAQTVCQAITAGVAAGMQHTRSARRRTRRRLISVGVARRTRFVSVVCFEGSGAARAAASVVVSVVARIALAHVRVVVASAVLGTHGHALVLNTLKRTRARTRCGPRCRNFVLPASITRGASCAAAERVGWALGALQRARCVFEVSRCTWSALGAGVARLTEAFGERSRVCI